MLSTVPTMRAVPSAGASTLAGGFCFTGLTRALKNPHISDLALTREPQEGARQRSAILGSGHGRAFKAVKKVFPTKLQNLAPPNPKS